MSTPRESIDEKREEILLTQAIRECWINAVAHTLAAGFDIQNFGVQWRRCTASRHRFSCLSSIFRKLALQ